MPSSQEGGGEGRISPFIRTSRSVVVSDISMSHDSFAESTLESDEVRMPSSSKRTTLLFRRAGTQPDKPKKQLSNAAVSVLRGGSNNNTDNTAKIATPTCQQDDNPSTGRTPRRGFLRRPFLHGERSSKRKPLKPGRSTMSPVLPFLRLRSGKREDQSVPNSTYTPESSWATIVGEEDLSQYSDPEFSILQTIIRSNVVKHKDLPHNVALNQMIDSVKKKVIENGGRPLGRETPEQGQEVSFRDFEHVARPVTTMLNLAIPEEIFSDETILTNEAAEGLGGFIPRTKRSKEPKKPRSFLRNSNIGKTSRTVPNKCPEESFEKEDTLQEEKKLSDDELYQAVMSTFELPTHRFRPTSLAMDQDQEKNDTKSRPNQSRNAARANRENRFSQKQRSSAQPAEPDQNVLGVKHPPAVQRGQSVHSVGSSVDNSTCEKSAADIKFLKRGTGIPLG